MPGQLFLSIILTEKKLIPRIKCTSLGCKNLSFQKKSAVGNRARDIRGEGNYYNLLIKIYNRTFIRHNTTGTPLTNDSINEDMMLHDILINHK